MKLFRRNTAPVKANGDDEVVPHRLTLDLARADKFAAMVANSRASRVVEVADLLAGMYIYNWERLSRYWGADDQERVEEILLHMRDTRPVKWNARIEQYDNQQQSRATR